MSPRWKFQVSYGVAFALIMTVISTIGDWWLMPEALHFNFAFLLKIVLWLLGGIFLMGYIAWKYEKNRK